MFAKRLISGIILVVFAIIFLFLGRLPLFIVSLILSLLGLFELYRVFGLEKTPLAIVGYIATIIYYLLTGAGREDRVILFLIVTLLFLLSIYVFTYPKYNVGDISRIYFGIFYVGVTLSFVYQLRDLPDGVYLVWLSVLSAWGNDTCAYCVGRLIGRHKMAPILSPKKTLEGAVGGVAGSVLLGLLFSIIFGDKMTAVLNPRSVCLVACVIASCVAFVGDLAASAVKRDYDVKDYGDLIPGHGGVLDRFDSLMFTAPAVYFVVLFMT